MFENGNQGMLIPGEKPNGQIIVSFLCKRTYDFEHGGICKHSKIDLPIHTADIPYADPMSSTIQYESDVTAFKPRTDVVLHGFAYPPKNSSYNESSCSLTVNQYKKDLAIFGNRVADISGEGEIRISKPDLFERIEIKYENAYGGVDTYTHRDEDLSYPYPRNYMGKGFIIKPQKKTQIELPNIEMPGHLLNPSNLLLQTMDNWEAAPIPAGFGWIGKGWKPRCDLAGVLPSHKEFENQLFDAYIENMSGGDKKILSENRLPTMNFDFYNGASEGLSFPYLNGDEEIRTNQLVPDGQCNFQLPGQKPQVIITLEGKLYEPKPKLHTILIRMEDKQVDITWCTSVDIPSIKWLTEVTDINAMIDYN